MKWAHRHMWIVVAALAVAALGYMFLLPASNVGSVAERSNG